MTEEIALAFSSLLLAIAVAAGVGPLFDALNTLNREFFIELEARMGELGMTTSWLPRASAARWLASAAAVIIGFLLGLVPIGAFLGVFVFNLFGVWLVTRVTNYRTRIRDQLVVVARDFANQVRAGLPLENALEATGRDLPAPLGPLLRRVVQQSRQGPGYFLQALERLKADVRLDGLTVFVIAVTVAHARGGDLAPLLDRLSYSLEEMQRVERKKDSDTAAGRMVVWLLSSFPFAFVAFFYAMDPESTGLLFSLTSGQVILTAIGATVYGSFRWAQGILRNVE